MWKIRSEMGLQSPETSVFPVKCPLARVLLNLSSMQYLNSRLFWDKKVRIALLALATFIAMC